MDKKKLYVSLAILYTMSVMTNPADAKMTKEAHALYQQACAYEFVESLQDGIYNKIGESGSGFSEGQIQRLAIARALLSNAPIILLDEATSALDAETERKILHNVLEKNRHRTLIFVTHRPSVLPLCNRVYRIERKILRSVSLEEAGRISADNNYESEN